MVNHDLTFVFFLIFFGASIFATIALYTKQAIIVAYIVLGALVGPFGFKIISSTNIIMEMSNIGIMFLLFLLGLNLQIKSLLGMLSKTVLVTIISSLIFACLSALVCYSFNFSWQESIFIGLTFIFSSTIICLKLLPTTVLHHRQIGNIVISVLLLQDIIAIVMLTLLDLLTAGSANISYFHLIKIFLALPALIIIGFLAQKYVLFHLLRKFNRFQEYMFLIAIGWCLGMAQIASWFGVSHEIGAFIAGVTLATSPISHYIYENLKPLRDFFLVVFFFAVGAGFNFMLLPQSLWVVLSLTLLLLLLKPIVYSLTLCIFKEAKLDAWEVGVRLGQASEFSLLLAFLAFQHGEIISQRGFIVIQAVTILTFIISSYIVVLKFPNPIAISDKLRRD